MYTLYIYVIYVLSVHVYFHNPPIITLFSRYYHVIITLLLTA